MILYGVIIAMSMMAITILNVIFNQVGFSRGYYIIAEVLFVLFAFLIDAVVAFIGRKLPQDLIDRDLRIYRMSKWERNLYRAIGVPKWKSHIPELGVLSGFPKSKIEDPKNPEYIRRFITEARYGVLIHLLSFPASLLIPFLDIRMWNGESNLWLTMGVPTMVINMALIVAPAFVLKWNLRPLVSIYERLGK